MPVRTFWTWASVAGAAKAGATDGLGDGAFDAGAQVVDLGPVLGGLAVLGAVGVHAGLVDGFGVDGDGAGLVGVDGPGALGAQRAGAAVADPEAEAEGDQAAGVGAHGAADGPGGAAGLPARPVDGEVGWGEGVVSFFALRPVRTMTGAIRVVLRSAEAAKFSALG